jgi:hypothetical protein
MQAFVKIARAIYKKIQDGVFDVSNEVLSFLFQIINLPDYNKHFHMNISYVILGISQLKLGNRILNRKVIMFFSQMQSVCCKKKVVLGC